MSRPAPKGTDRAVFVLELWGKLLPERIATEDLGGFIEDIHRSPTRGMNACGLYSKVVLAMVSTGLNSVREIWVRQPPVPSNRSAAVVTLASVVFATAYLFGASQQIYFASHIPSALLQSTTGVLVSVGWFVCAARIFRKRTAHRWIFAVALATSLHTVLSYMAGIMGGRALVICVAYSIAMVIGLPKTRRHRADVEQRRL